MESNKDVFQYTYSAKQQEEIEAIRKKYLPSQEDKMEQLRRLDKSATKKGTALSIAVGVAGCLLMGVGMCCSMVWMGNLFVPGIILGLLGIALVAVAHPILSLIHIFLGELQPGGTGHGVEKQQHAAGDDKGHQHKKGEIPPQGEQPVPAALLFLPAHFSTAL